MINNGRPSVNENSVGNGNNFDSTAQPAHENGRSSDEAIALARRFARAIACTANGTRVEARVAFAGDELESYSDNLDLSGAEVLYLDADDGTLLGIVLKPNDEAEARQLIAVMQAPSIDVSAQSTDGRMQRGLLYLFDTPLTGDALATATDMIQRKTGRGVKEQALPIPGIGPIATLSDIDSRRLGSGGALSRFPADVILEALERLPDAPVEARTEPFVYKHAQFVGGDLKSEVMGLKMKLGIGRSANDKRWPVKEETTFFQFVNVMSKHVPGDKDGRAFLQGEAIDNERRAKAMRAMYIMGLDVDSGIQIEPVVRKIQDELGLAAIVYTTHSHLSTMTHVSQSAFAKFAKKRNLDTDPTNETMQRYVREDRSWEQPIADTVTVEEEQEQTSDGMQYVLHHDPIPKFRIVFPLAEPYVFAKQKMSQDDAIQLWKGKLLGLAKILDIPIDESCLDPSRLFFFPRHRKGAEFAVYVTNGDAIRFEKIPELMPRAKDRPTDDVFAEAAKALGASERGLFIGDFSLRRWAGETANLFDIARLFRERADERIRHDDGQDKLEIECPFDSEHSNAGDTEDRACFVVSAHADGTDRGFAFGCQHNSCKRRDRLEFIAEAVDSGWFAVEDLKDETFRVFTIDDDPEMVARKLIERAEGLEKKALYAERASILREAVTSGVKASAIHQIIAALVRKPNDGFTATVARAIVKEVRADKRQAKADQDESDGRVVVGIGDDHSPATDKALAALVARNAKEPRLFQSAGSLVRLRVDPKIDVAEFQVLGPSTLPHELRKAVSFRTAGEDPRELPAPKDIVADILANQHTGLPIVSGIVRTPFFAKGSDGRLSLVSKPGYHAASGYYFQPSAGFEMKPVSEQPSAEEIARAKTLLLDDVLGDFPFADDATDGRASRTHALCMLLQPFMREAIAGPTPLYFVTKPMPGTGGGLLIDSVMLITTGLAGEAQIDAKSDEERRKNITAAFRSGRSYLWIDNVHDIIDSSVYASLATSERWEDRLLGQSRKVAFPNNIMVVFVGNNPTTSQEIARRLLAIFLDAKGNPLKRKAFRHSDLKAWVRANRSELVWACLTLIQAWVAAGEPKDMSEPLASFEAYSATMRGLMTTIGEEGFLGNFEQVRKSANDEGDAWETLISAWAEKFGMGPNNIRPVGDPDQEGQGINSHWNGSNSLVRLIEDLGIGIPMSGSAGPGKVKSLSNTLKGKANNVFEILVGGQAVEVTLRREKMATNTYGFWLEPKRAIGE